MVNCVIVNASPSKSESLFNKFSESPTATVNVVSSGVVLLSSTATGISLIEFIVMSNVEVSVPPLPSSIV